MTEGYHLRRDAMQWFWDQYATDSDCNQITALPLCASVEQRKSLQTGLVITTYCAMKDEGKAYANYLREAGVFVSPLSVFKGQLMTLLC